MAESRSGYLPTLDGWRAIAALTVFMFHDTIFASGCSSKWLLSLSSCLAWSAVSLFFGISGLLITSRLLEEREFFGEIHLSGFYVRRACRILPAAWLYLIAILLLGRFSGAVPLDKQDWFGALFFYRNYNYSSGGWAARHFWSLAVEEHFYFIWPALLFYLGNRRAAWVAASLCLACLLCRFSLAPGPTGLGPNDAVFLSHIRIDALLFPSMLAILLRDDGIRESLRNSLTPPRWAVLAGIWSLTLWTPGYVWKVAAWMLTIQAATTPLLIVGPLLHPEWTLGRVLEGRPITWLGRISYSLYLWQHPFTHWQSLSILFRLPMTIGCAAMSFYLVERPFMRLGHRLAPSATPGRPDLVLERPQLKVPAIFPDVASTPLELVSPKRCGTSPQ
jgi:peptidoglycan/LPS O-acetylase OafA/YrhL